MFTAKIDYNLILISHIYAFCVQYYQKYFCCKFLAVEYLYI